MPNSSTRINDLPHVRVDAGDLAEWLTAHGRESWWTADGDPYLTQRRDFPCLGSDLADTLHEIDRQLLLFDPKGVAAEGKSNLERIDRAAITESTGDRVLHLCWEDRPEDDWLLVEDREFSPSGPGLDGDEDR